MSLLVLCAAMIALGGCQFFGFIAYAIDEATPTKVAAEYDGLAGESFTVVVRAERSILADFPGVADTISINVNEMLRENLPETNDGEGTTGFIPPVKQLQWISNHPRWRIMMPSELGEQLGVTRLVIVDLFTFRLHDPGNRYVWNGEASGVVRVFEIDSPLPNDAVYEREIRVNYPTAKGYTSGDLTVQQVSSVLVGWFSRRAGWTMIDHEEPKDIEF